MAEPENTKKTKKQKTIFLPQSFLSYRNFFSTRSLEKSDLDKDHVAKVTGNYMPPVLMSKMFGQVDGVTVDENFLNLENHKLSALVPEVILFRVENTEGSKVHKPFYFPVSSDYSFSAGPEGGVMFNPGEPFSATAAEIQSFSVTYTGKGVYEASRKFVEASLSLKVDHMSTIFKEKEGYAPLASLFTISALGRPRPQPEASSAKVITPNALEHGRSYQIAAVMGYNVPRNGIFTPQEIMAIEKTKIYVNLFLRSHSFSVNPNGSVEINVNYTGFLEAMHNDAIFDLITPESAKRKLIKDRVISEASTDLGTFLTKKKDQNEDLDEEKAAALERASMKDIINAFKEIVATLSSRGKIYNIDFDDGYFVRTFGEETISSPPAAESTTNAPKIPLDKRMLGLYNVAYFTFGDFVEAYFEKIKKDLEKVLDKPIGADLFGTDPAPVDTVQAGVAKDDEDAEEKVDKYKEAMNKRLAKLKSDIDGFTILTSNFLAMEINPKQADPQEFVRNIANIPISMDVLMTLVHEELTSVGRVFYDFYTFISGFCMNMLSRALQEMPGSEIVHDIEFKIATFSANNVKSSINKGIIKVQDLPRPVENYGNFISGELQDYIVIHQAPPTYTAAPGMGTPSEDAKNGIFHLRASQTQGLVKSIQFSVIQMSSREAYLVARGARAFDELRIPHDASVEMIGNNMFLPMSFVYVNPDTIGFGDPRDLESAARRLGLGGYYTVVSVTTTYTSAGTLTTQLTLKHNGFPSEKTMAEAENVQIQSINEVRSRLNSNP